LGHSDLSLAFSRIGSLLTVVKREHIVVPSCPGGTVLIKYVPLTEGEMLAKKPLTDRGIAALKPAPSGKRRIEWDALVPGLGVRVTDRGVRTFVLVARFQPNRNPTPRKLGAVGAISLASARDKARHWLELIGKGVDPQVQAIERRQQTFQAIAGNYFI